MPRLVLAVTLAFFSISVFAQESAISQARQPGQNWEEALRKSAGEQNLSFDAGSALEVSGLNTFAIEGIPEWTYGLEALADLFTNAKEIRLHENPNPGDFDRKAAWLYPNDGCYSKAAHVSYIAKTKELTLPGKIYAFGRLRYESPYAENGKTVYWSYHMAAAYHIGEVVYVVDPAITAGPIPSTEWLALISADPVSVRVSRCDSNSYSPHSKCVGSNNNGAYLGHMRGILQLEWSNLSNLGHDPTVLLGP